MEKVQRRAERTYVTVGMNGLQSAEEMMERITGNSPK